MLVVMVMMKRRAVATSITFFQLSPTSFHSVAIFYENYCYYFAIEFFYSYI